MTWLSQQDRDEMAGWQAASRIERARINGTFVKICIYVDAQYPKVPSELKLDLPRAMRDSEALEYAASIGHPKERVRGFYASNGSYWRNED